MDFAHLTYRESLRDIEACLRTMGPKLYHMGIHSTVSCNNLAPGYRTFNGHASRRVRGGITSVPMEIRPE